MSYDLFSNGLLRKNLLGQHPGQHCAKLARGALSWRSPGGIDATIAPKRLSELLNESARQATGSIDLTETLVTQRPDSNEEIDKSTAAIPFSILPSPL